MNSLPRFVVAQLAMFTAETSSTELADPDESRPFVSVVIPAYNEEARLPRSLTEVLRYLSEQPYCWEVIIVDDGSVDGTLRLAEETARSQQDVIVVRNQHAGKAYAVRSGMLKARGSYLYMCDADLSTPITELERFLAVAETGVSVVIGSREALGSHRVGEPWRRHVMGRVFNSLVRLIALRRFHDTQCGFKLLRRDAAHAVFTRARLYATPGTLHGPALTGFDVEVIYLAERLGFRVQELPVFWRYEPGSKLHPIRESLRMLRDILTVRLNDARGYYDT